MLRKLLMSLPLLLAACTYTPSSKVGEVPLSVDTGSLTFSSAGGQDKFTVETSEQLIVMPGDVWITCSKEPDGDNKYDVTVSLQQNNSQTTRQTRITLTAGEEKKYVEITQKGLGEESGDTGIIDPSAKLVALSFDDGPNNITTPKMLDILEEHGVPASFFVIGKHINDSSAEQMKRAISLGCEIQNHSFTHTFMTQHTTESFKDEIKRTDDLIEKYVGVRPTMFRPPYINHNPSMHDAIEHTFISGVGCQDWEANRTAQMRYDDLMAQVKDGDIILLHDFEGNDNTVEALKTIIPELQKRGYTLVTVSDLFARKGVSPKGKSGIIYTNVLQ